MAIKIIKPGKELNLHRTRRFTCLLCGCVFDADHGDYDTIVGQYDETVYWAFCPNCHHSTCRSELLEKEVSDGN